MKGILPTTFNEGEKKSYRIVYTIYELLARNSDPKTQEDTSSRLIGLVTLRSVDAGNLALPNHIFPDSVHSPDCLTMELGYQFLPAAWGKGFATEAVRAVLDACQREQNFWDNYQKVYIRAIVNGENPASRRVLVKSGMQELAVHVWDGDGIWLAGKWRTTDNLHIFGKFVKE
jgi:RimJ/RimL family protein N-acetyltransferase